MPGVAWAAAATARAEARGPRPSLPGAVARWTRFPRPSASCGGLVDQQDTRQGKRRHETQKRDGDARVVIVLAAAGTSAAVHDCTPTRPCFEAHHGMAAAVEQVRVMRGDDDRGPQAIELHEQFQQALRERRVDIAGWARRPG